MKRKKNTLALLGKWKNKLWNMKVMFILIRIGGLGTVTERLLKELEVMEIRGRVDTLQTTTLLRSVRTLKNAGDLIKLAVASVKDQQQTYMWKTLQE